MHRATIGSLAVAGMVVGIAAERQAYAWSELRSWLPDLLAGWLLIGFGLALHALRGPRSASLLLVLAGLLWFAANFQTAGAEVFQRIAGHAAYLHRAPLFQLALAPATGRPRTLLAATGVGIAWVASIVWPLWDDDVSALMLAAALVAVAATGWVQTVGRLRRTVAARGLVVVLVLASTIAADAVRGLSAGAGGADTIVLIYAIATGVTAALLFSAARLDAPGSLAERAVELERSGTRLRDALRELLGDPVLEVAFTDEGGETLDDAGRPIVVRHDGRAETTVAVGGEPVATILHDPATLQDEATRAAVIAATGLAAERARLRAEVARRIAAVDASRRRLLEAEEEERRRLAEQLDRGPGSEVARIEQLVLGIEPSDEQLAPALERAVDQLTRVRPELDALIRGLGGVRAAELVPALTELAVALPIDVQLELAVRHLPDDVASALWFVCSESLANTVKHSGGTRAQVSLTQSDGSVELSVQDDGRGGAETAGSGLTGLADRLATLGGALTVISPPGAGTRVLARLPLG